MATLTASDLLRIGQLSDRSQVPIKTIRYYEELGLIQARKRTSGGFRLFDVEALTRLAFIKRSQSLGLSLQEIHDILAIHDQGQRPCEEVKHTLQAKVAEIEEKIQALTLLREQILALIAGADGLKAEAADICPIIENRPNTPDSPRHHQPKG
ncbi:heavy metal-responsive transcriptional regulator [filamentous cyanobacterium CCP5]|nr:heavy metal-responsive transcriptional regulator [filamentous cyanobacterium CCP5]